MKNIYLCLFDSDIEPFTVIGTHHAVEYALEHLLGGSLKFCDVRPSGFIDIEWQEETGPDEDEIVHRVRCYPQPEIYSNCYGFLDRTKAKDALINLCSPTMETVDNA